MCVSCGKREALFLSESNLFYYIKKTLFINQFISFMTNIYITDIYICIHFHISQGIHISKEQTFIYAHEQSHHI